MQRVLTGIKGFDEMLGGGIPKGRHVALCGGPGSGKTLFSMEFLYRGVKAGEPGIYLSLEEAPDKLVENVQAAFSELDITETVGDLLVVKKPTSFEMDAVASLIEEVASDISAERLVIDSATILRAKFKEAYEYRETLYEFFDLLRVMDLTVIMTVEVETPERKHNYGIEHFLMDGIVNLYNLDKKNERVRALEVIKMRGTKHSPYLVPFRITPSGIVVYKDERVF